MADETESAQPVEGELLTAEPIMTAREHQRHTAAFLATDPGASDWHTGSWATTASGGYQAQCLVGPANGGVALTVGTYQVWVPADYLQIN